MSFPDIQKALVAGFNAGSFGIPTAHSNRNFDPPASGGWCELNIVPNQPEAITIGAGGEDEQNGVFQVHLNYPKNQGSKDILTKAEEIRLNYISGKAFSEGGTEVKILNCGRGGASVVDGWYSLTLTINWYARITRGSV